MSYEAKIIASKRCSRCKQHLQLSCFGSCSQTKDGLKTWCRDCRSSARREKRIQSGNPPRLWRASGKVYRADGSKHCPWCDTWKPPQAYAACRQNRGGLATHCKDCINKYQEEARRKAGSPPRVTRNFDSVILRYFGQRECVGCSHVYPSSEFRPSRNGHHGLGPYCTRCNTKYIEEYQARRRQDINEWARKWRQDNERWKVAHRGRQHKRRAIVKSSADVTKDFLDSLYAQTNCEYCGRLTEAKDRTADHVVPLASGGEHSPSNLVMACGSCNFSKHDDPVEVFLVRLARKNGAKACPTK